jgi:toxin ParE1/3/4
MSPHFDVLITERAQRDVNEIWEYISRDTPEAADRFMTELLEQVTKLETFPESMSLIKENDALGVDCYRQLLLKDYRTIFRIQEQTVVIIRVIHGAKLLSL